jgi:hypothetical protein
MLEHCLLSVNYSQKYFSHSFMLHNWTGISINPPSTKKFFFKSWSHFSVCGADQLDHLVRTGVCVTNFFIIKILCRHNFIPLPHQMYRKQDLQTYAQTDFAMFGSYSGRQGGKQVGWQAGGNAGRRVGIQKDRCPHIDTDKQT